jgi:ABC-type spermidine/putrescine transport system permease subunit I
LDELNFFLGLSVVTIIVIGLVIYVGQKLNNAVNKHSARINFPMHITLAGTALWACVVGFWVICAVARELKPDSLFGNFLNSTDGAVLTFAGSILFAAIAAVILEKLGYPIAIKGSKPHQ